jgi:ABC-type phosphate/phosphonate transport system substrate-binding protein
VVIRSGLHPELKDRLRSELLALDVNSHVYPTLAGFGLERFTPVTYEHYAPEEQALQECERLLGDRLYEPGSRLRSLE